LDPRRWLPRHLRRSHSFLSLYFGEVHILMRGRARIGFLSFFFFFRLLFFFSVLYFSATAQPPAQKVFLFSGQSEEAAAAKSTGCISCHGPTDEPTMHPSKTVHLGCTDCHGGNSSMSAANTDPNSADYKSAKEKAHIHPHDPIFKNRSAVPED